MLLRAIGYDTDRDILNLFDIADEVKVTKANVKKLVGRKLAARLLKTWVEDFVDEDTGEVVSIERNEVIFERDMVISDDMTDRIIDAQIDMVTLQKKKVY